MRLRSVFFLSLSLLYLMGSAAQVQAIESGLGITEKWSGDYDGMVERHLIRALVPPSKAFYFNDEFRFNPNDCDRQSQGRILGSNIPGFKAASGCQTQKGRADCLGHS